MVSKYLLNVEYILLNIIKGHMGSPLSKASFLVQIAFLTWFNAFGDSVIRNFVTATPITTTTTDVVL